MVDRCNHDLLRQLFEDIAKELHALADSIEPRTRGLLGPAIPAADTNTEVDASEES